MRLNALAFKITVNYGNITNIYKVLNANITHIRVI
jgi:hypothetical protein